MKISQLIRKQQSSELSDLQLEEGLLKIASTAQRVGKVVKGLSSISRNSENDPMKKIRLFNVIDETLQLCFERFKSHSIMLNFELDAIIDVEIDGKASQIMQVLLNLLNNAFDAVLGLSEMWVTVKAIPVELGIIIMVTDSGDGIPDHKVVKIMQPFFTTKEVGKGTGLGLSISKSIVDDHQGKLYYQKNADHTCFVIELPYVHKATVKKS